jgi:TPR repeat protein
MKRAGRARSLGCLLLLLSAFALADGNSLLIPAAGSCALHSAPEDLPEALQACQQSADKGDAQAQYELGDFYYLGQDGKRDLPQALQWFERASLQGHAEAQYHLGLMFFHGEGVNANNVQAYIVLKMAAVNGSDAALDSADEVSAQMPRAELEVATEVLGQIFRNYLQELQAADSLSPFSPLH